MPNSLDNARIAEQLESFAALLDLSGSSFYTSRAYRRAAETIRETKAPIAELIAAGRVEELRGIGPGIATRLRELVETGRIAELDELEREVQPELIGLGRVLGGSAPAGARCVRGAPRDRLGARAQRTARGRRDGRRGAGRAGGRGAGPLRHRVRCCDRHAGICRGSRRVAACAGRRVPVRT